MKNLKKVICFVCLVFVGLGCSDSGSLLSGLNAIGPTQLWDETQHDADGENRFILTSEEAVSTFSIDVDTASYAYARRSLNEGKMPERDKLRTEEFVNYFKYSHLKNEAWHDNIYSGFEIGKAPWTPENRLIKVILGAKEMEFKEVAPLNLVFLIDTSGSMAGEYRLEMVKFALRQLLSELREQDTISIVTYASGIATPLEGKTIKDVALIQSVIHKLGAQGATAGHQGLQTAYQVAHRYVKPNSINRVILSTDGDFNVGLSSTEELVDFVKTQANEGVYLTVHGYGMGNYNDEMLEQITNYGNGNYAYIDSYHEAEKVFKMQITQTLGVAAKDVKVQLEFNPKRVEAYRLIGYENRLLDNEDFENDAVDSGDMGSGHRVVAFYEIRLAESCPQTKDEPKECILVHDPLLADFRVRYKNPQSAEVKNFEVKLEDHSYTTSSDFCFASSVAAFALKLRGSKYIGSTTYNDIINWSKECDGTTTIPERQEFLHLVEKAQKMVVIQ